MDIYLDSISKRFDDKIIFDNFFYTFKNGITTAVCGESGCGKTTLLRIIAGLDKDYSGTVEPAKFEVSVAFQEHRLFPGATVLENMKVADKNNISHQLLLELGIGEENFSLLPNELSGGMARRVSLARAIAKKADLYLFDEPFSGLDSENSAKAAEIIKKYCKDKTCIVVTHNTELAKSFADEFLFL